MRKQKVTMKFHVPDEQEKKLLSFLHLLAHNICEILSMQTHTYMHVYRSSSLNKS